MKTSQFGRGEIARREGTKLSAYQDSKGVWTIGTGHTSAAGDPKVSKGLKITAWEADQILSRDLGTVENTVNGNVRVPLNQNEFDALASLVFNIGGAAFRGSTVLRKLNAGDRAGAADALGPRGLVRPTAANTPTTQPT
jgi:lysozyme